eukprot:1043724-Pleurochrysis_carterae.AAC.1
MACFRAVQYAKKLLTSHEWRTEDSVRVIARLGLVEALFESREMWVLRTQWVRTVLAELIQER